MLLLFILILVVFCNELCYREVSVLRVESYAFCIYNTGRNYAVLIKWWLINIVLNICVFHFSVFIFF